MKNKRSVNPFFRIMVFVSVLMLTAVAVSIGLYYYVFSIPEPEGLSLASWPHTFTNNFSLWMENENGTVKIKDIGIERLEEYGLWIQVIDDSGQEVFSHNKPEAYPKSYSASALVQLSQSAYEHGNTIFVSRFEENGTTWSYAIGFPYAIGKYMLYYNGGNVERLSPVFRAGLLFVLCAIVLLVFVYGFWLTGHLGKITKGIGSLSLRTYRPLKESGMFSEIYGALNEMDAEIRRSDKMQQDTERVRTEWISNITHDLKTPLSPVKGYAELLADCPAPDGKTVQEYGAIILKNVSYAETLINDLKLTYQLESGAIPYHPKEVRMVRYVKELVIDLVNNPTLMGSDLAFEAAAGEITACIDPHLFRRAVQNIIINAMTHNPPGTNVTVRIEADAQKGVCIFIRDNGGGMSKAQLSKLWNRYYRGTNTKENPEGSGLGLAIAKQIVTLHGGDITVQSKQGEGTEFAVSLPLGKK